MNEHAIQILDDHNVNGVSEAYTYIYIYSNNSPASIPDFDANRWYGCKTQSTPTFGTEYQRNGNVILTSHAIVSIQIYVLFSGKSNALREGNVNDYYATYIRAYPILITTSQHEIILGFNAGTRNKSY